MAATELTIAVDPNDRTLPLMAGVVEINGVAPKFVSAPLEEIFARAFDDQAFDVTELSFSNYLYLTSKGESPYIGLPIFPSRSFRHACFYTRTDRGITSPRDLIGRTVGVREYSMTAALVARGVLEDEYGIKASDIDWVYGPADVADTMPVARMMPRGVALKPIAGGANLSDLLAEGAIDAMVAYKPPPAFLSRGPNVDRLFRDVTAVEMDYAERTGIFPIMHLIGIRSDLAVEKPELIPAICDGFEKARAYSMGRLAQSQALYTMLPWAVQSLAQTTAALRPNYWSYGVANNRAALEALCRYSYSQGISERVVSIDELFAKDALSWTPSSTPA